MRKIQATTYQEMYICLRVSTYSFISSISSYKIGPLIAPRNWPLHPHSRHRHLPWKYSMYRRLYLEGCYWRRTTWGIFCRFKILTRILVPHIWHMLSCIIMASSLFHGFCASCMNFVKHFTMFPCNIPFMILTPFSFDCLCNKII